MIYVYTSAALNYLPKVKLLTESVRKYLPDCQIILALADKLSDDVEFNRYEIDEVISVDDFKDEIDNFVSWVFRHTIVELSTAIKPFVLNRLLQRDDCEAVLYFDPDIVLFSELEDLLVEFDHASILLTPHVTIPESSDELVADNELCALKHGVYNFGFYGVKKTSEGLRYASWWKDRVALQCYDDIPNGIFTDQKWNDLVPGLFDEVKILRSPRFNVASWNTTQRKILGSFNEGFNVNGEPLGFYHFTGFDSGDHSIMVNKNSISPEVQSELVAWYQDHMDKLGKDSLCQTAWAYAAFDNGNLISDQMRTDYRLRLDLQHHFPNPFQTRDVNSSYLHWYRSQSNQSLYKQWIHKVAKAIYLLLPLSIRTSSPVIRLKEWVRNK